MNTNDQHSRRDFLKRSAGIAGSAFLATSVLGLTGCEETTFKANPAAPSPGMTIEGNRIKLDTSTSVFAALAAVGGYATVDALGQSIMVFRFDGDRVSALSRLCTHQGCDLTPGGSNNAQLVGQSEVECGCHGSMFNIESGAVTRDPATANLKKFPATVSNNIITIDLS